MKNELMVFEGHEVEVFEFEGKILFNPKHVGECLGLSSITVRRHIQEMNEKQVIKLKNLDVQDMNIRKLNNAGENFLTESGVYKLIFKSKKEEAERFQDWVTDEVLPSIRQTGGYIPTTEEDDEESIMAKALLIAQKTLDKKNKQIKDLTKEKDQLQSTLDKFLSTKGLYDIGTFAKVLDIPKLGRNNMFKWFKTHNYLMSSNEPYQQYMKYFSVKNVERNSIVVTKTLLKPEGVIYFYKKISQEFNIDKTIEQVSKELKEEE